MSLALLVVGEPNQSLYATLQKMTESGSLGDHWDEVNKVWASAPSTNNRKITLTAGTGIYVGSYTGGTGQLGTYSGLVVLRIHDTNLADQVVGAREYTLINGVRTYEATTKDIQDVPLATWLTINAQGGVLSSNMRGTDNALLAANYVAPANATIATAAADALAAKTAAQAAQTDSAAAKTAAQSADGKLPADTSTKLGRLDVAVSTRSSHAAADIRADINANGGVLSSNMRGTDNALLASGYTAPNNAGIGTAAADAAAAKAAAEAVSGRLTTTRAGYLDNLSAGAVATQATVNAITNSTRVKLAAVDWFQIPASGSTVYTLDILCYDTSGNMEAADATPTVTAANQSGTDRSANVGAVATISTGHYRTTYTVASAHATEQLLLTASVVEGGQTLKAVHAASASVGNAGGGGGGDGFLAADRTKLEAIHAKLPSKAYLAGTALADGDIDLAEMVGDRGPFKADVSGLSTAVSVAGIPAAVRSELNSNPVPASNMRGTDGALLAASYTAPDNAGITTTVTQATSAATAAASANTNALAAKAAAEGMATSYTSLRAAKLDNLDVLVSSRSTFNPGATGVTLAGGHGLSLEATSQAIKAKTDLIPNAPAAVGDVPTAAAVAAQAVAAIEAEFGAGPYTQGGGDATLAKQDQILSQIAALTPTPVSPQSVDASRTWILRQTGDGATAGNIVTTTTADVVTLAMDFSRQLNAGTTITAVTEVVVVEGSALTVTGAAPNGSRQIAHFTVSTATAGVRWLRVKVTTSDGQTITGRGYLEVR